MSSIYCFSFVSVTMIADKAECLVVELWLIRSQRCHVKQELPLFPTNTWHELLISLLFAVWLAVSKPRPTKGLGSVTLLVVYLVSSAGAAQMSPSTLLGQSMADQRMIQVASDIHRYKAEINIFVWNLFFVDSCFFGFISISNCWSPLWMLYNWAVLWNKSASIWLQMKKGTDLQF